jgi:hypothetical protein
VTVVFAGRIFGDRRGDDTERAKVADYARSVGVPEEQLDWSEWAAQGTRSRARCQPAMRGRCGQAYGGGSGQPNASTSACMSAR